jgi:hypothetical protein
MRIYRVVLSKEETISKSVSEDMVKRLEDAPVSGSINYYADDSVE